jgi:hypothetical protein
MICPKSHANVRSRSRRQENLNIEHMMRIHRGIEEVVHDKQAAEALKPWYMHR